MILNRTSNGTRVLALAALGALIVGCGGSGSSDSGPGKSYAGSYRTGLSMDRAESAILLVVVDASGKADLVVSTRDGVAYSGSGKIDGTGRVSIQAKDAQDSEAASETFALVFQGGDSPQMTGTASGAFAASGLGAARSSANPFAGTYAVDYDGDASGDGSLTVDAAGKITGAVDYDGSTVRVSGALKGAGNLTFAAKGNASGTDYTVSWSGAFYLTPDAAQGAGTWKSSSGYEGEWSASKG